MDAEIEAGERVIGKRGEVKLDEEALAIKAQRDAKKALYDQVFGIGQLSDQARLERAIAAAERDATEYERKVREKDLGPMRKKEGKPLPTSQRLDAARAKRA